MAALASATRTQRPTAYNPENARPRASTGPSSRDPRMQPTASRRDKAAKPIIDWITRKLGATRRPSAGAPETPLPAPSSGGRSAQQIGDKARQATPLVLNTERRLSRRSASPGQHLARSFTTNSASRAESHSLRSMEASPSHRHPFPLAMYNLERNQAESSTFTSRSPSMRSHSSLASYSARTRDDGSFFSGFRADEDASLRPIAPSRPVSFAQSAAYPEPSTTATTPSAQLKAAFEQRRLSEASSEISSESPSRMGRSGASSASTKPTTLMSIDMRPRAAHIAQAPQDNEPHPGIPASGPSSDQVSFPSSPAQSSTRGMSHVGTPPDSGPHRRSLMLAEHSVPPPATHVQRTQAPKHSQPHPRDNPRPSSPPRANASMVTLASSTFATQPATPTPSQGPSLPLSPQSRQATRYTPHSTIVPGTPSVTWADPSGDPSSAHGEPSSRSLFGDQYSNYALSHLTSSIGGRRRSFEDDASDRAVRRRGSWESAESGWSWRGPARGAPSSVGPSSIGGRNSISISLRSRGPDQEPRPSASPLVLGSVV